MKEEGEEGEGRGRDVGSETGGRIFQFFYTVLWSPTDARNVGLGSLDSTVTSERSEKFCN
jgi:hypothetical protein